MIILKSCLLLTHNYFIIRRKKDEELMNEKIMVEMLRKEVSDSIILKDTNRVKKGK